MAIFTAIGGYLTATFGPLIAGIIGNIAIGVALIGAQQLFFGGNRPQQSTSTPQAQGTLNQSTGPRIRGYGRAKLGGTRAFWDSKSGILYQVIMAHHGQVDAFEQFYIGDLPVALDADGYVQTAPLAGFATIRPLDGSANQISHPLMVADWPEIWTHEHRLRGIANWMVIFRSTAAADFQTVFPEGYNTAVRCICRLTRVWDPRTNITAWSDNASLCILDYLTHPDGYGRAREDVDVESFAAFADICDQQVLRAAGGYEPRYRIWGVYALTDEPQDVLSKMRAACDAELYQTAEGKIAIRGGVWQAPTVTIRDSDILAHSMEQGSNKLSAFNELKIIYTSPDHDYQAMEATPWEDFEDQADRGVLASSITLDMVPSPSQARRLAKIHIAKSNPQWKGTIVANLSALNALGERTVRLVIPELGIDDAFFVAGFSLRPDLTGVELSVMSISEAAYSWTTAEEGQSPPIPEDTRPDMTFPVPEIVSLVFDDPDIIATADDPGRTDLELHAQIRAGAGSLWQEMETDGFEALFDPPDVVAPTIFQVRARWRGPLNSAGQWSDLSEIIISP